MPWSLLPIGSAPSAIVPLVVVPVEPAARGPAASGHSPRRFTNMTKRHVLVGIGPGAVAAAEAIRAADDGAEITIVAADSHGYYSRPGLAYLMTREMPQQRLHPFSEEEFTQLDVRRVVDRVTGIDLAARRVSLAGGSDLPYDCLLIATGSRSTPAKVPGAELDGVVKLDDMADALGIIQRCHEAKSAVVVGGGITALEIVEGLRARKVHVHYFLRRDRFWASVLSGSESQFVADGLRRDGVEVHQRTELARILGTNGHVTGVETGDGVRIACEMVAVAVGVRPVVDLAQAAGLNCARGILVDQYLRSSDARVFAAGDVAEVHDPQTGKGTLHVLWNTAVDKGRVAGHNMAGAALEPAGSALDAAGSASDATGARPMHVYHTGHPLNITRLAGLHTTIIGSVGGGEDADLQSLSRGASQVWSEPTEAVIVEAGSDEEHIRLALGDGVIAGAVVMGDQTLSFPLQDLIERRVDVRHIQADLMAPAPPISELVHSAWHGSGGNDVQA
jgi:NAD(P)H-nitrite reductase large subunit